MDKLYRKTVIRRTNIKVSTNFHDLYVYFCEIHNFYCAAFASPGGANSYTTGNNGKVSPHLLIRFGRVELQGPTPPTTDPADQQQNILYPYLLPLLCYLPQTATTDCGLLFSLAGCIVVGRFADFNKKLYFVNIF